MNTAHETKGKSMREIKESNAKVNMEWSFAIPNGKLLLEIIGKQQSYIFTLDGEEVEKLRQKLATIPDSKTLCELFKRKPRAS